MNTKRTKISTLRAEASKLIALADALEAIPDDVYYKLFPDGVVSVESSPSITELLRPTQYDKTPTENKDWGNRKKIVLGIIKAHGLGMLKEEITTKYESKTNTKNQLSTVMNALTALRLDGILENCKPLDSTFKVRGKYWGLKDWFRDGQLIDRYAPYPVPRSLL